MSSSDVSERHAVVTAENIGGIDHTDVTLTDGINVLAGRNATNRTSFLQAIMAALGSNDVSLKSDEEEGRVELTIGDERYTRILRRRGDGSIAFGGEPYLEDSERADLFAFLLESNEARRAIVTGADLRELIMRPVDTDEIQREIERLEREKREVDEKLEELDDLGDRLPELEQRRTALEDDIEAKRDELADVNERIEAEDTDVEQSREQRSRFEETLEQLQNARSEREDVQYRIDTERESIDSLEAERDELADDLDSLPEQSEAELEALERELDQLRRRKGSIDSLITQLQNVIQFNEGILGGEASELHELMYEDGDDLTDQLLGEEETTQCWTCGSTVDSRTIETNLEQLRELQQEQVSRLSDINDELDELKTKQRELRQTRDKHDRLRERLENVEAEIDRRRSNLEALEEQRSELDERISELESEAEALDTGDHTELIELHKQASEIEVELEQLVDEKDTVEAEIDRIETRLAEREELESHREDIAATLSEQRSRIDRVEAEAVEAFNDHMDELLSLLEYENIDRIWIERTTETVREGRGTVEKDTFDLHIVRSSDDGGAYEDRVEHLSESEREVTGIVFALAGYLVHEVYETVPFMLLDSLEAIDAPRIAELLGYVETYADYLVVALLPEDAAAVDEAAANRIETI